MFSTLAGAARPCSALVLGAARRTHGDPPLRRLGLRRAGDDHARAARRPVLRAALASLFGRNGTVRGRDGGAAGAFVRAHRQDAHRSGASGRRGSANSSARRPALARPAGRAGGGRGGRGYEPARGLAALHPLSPIVRGGAARSASSSCAPGRSAGAAPAGDLIRSASSPAHRGSGSSRGWSHAAGTEEGRLRTRPCPRDGRCGSALSQVAGDRRGGARAWRGRWAWPSCAADGRVSGGAARLVRAGRRGGGTAHAVRRRTRGPPRRRPSRPGGGRGGGAGADDRSDAAADRVDSDQRRSASMPRRARRRS